MTHPDRGLFDPPEDELDVFDATDEPEPEPKRSPLFVILAVLVLAAFAGVIWVAYSQGVQQGERAAPPVLTADATPVKVPASAETAAPTGSDFRVLDPSAADARTEALAPAPEEPQPLVPAPDLPEPATTVVEQAALPPPAQEPEQPVATAEPETEAPSAAIVEEAPVQTMTAVVSPSAPEPQPQPQPAVAPSTPQPEVAVAAPAPAVVPSSAADAGNFVVQVSAHKTDAEAAGAWERLRAAETDLLGELRPSILRADLGDRGIWYRLRVGPFETKQAAQQVCNSLKTRGRDCMVREP